MRVDYTMEMARETMGDEAVIIVAEFPEIDHVLAYRGGSYQPWVAAWAYNGKNSWGQGHYFSKLEDAVTYIMDKRIAKQLNVA